LFPTKDGLYAMIACSTEKLWRQLRSIIGDESLKVFDDDPQGRVERREELEGRISNWTRSYDLPELLETCGEAGLAIGPIYSAEEILNDPHIKARESIITVDEPETGKPIRMASPAGRFSGFQGEVRHLGPRLGEHTDKILNDLLNLSPERIAVLREKAIVK
jgi:crotonobetainyl-CoA:carnitine CoA-transferase CaiB-like acyl-CoA transferase